MLGGIRRVLQTPKISNPQVTERGKFFCKRKPQKHKTAGCLNFAKFQGLALRHCFSRSGVRPGTFLKMFLTSHSASSWVRIAIICHLQNPISPFVLGPGLIVYIWVLSLIFLEKLCKIICTFYLTLIPISL